MLLSGVFWRIVIIEAILMVWSVGWRAYSEGGTFIELSLYALRIMLLVGIIVGFVWFTLRSFLSSRIIRPLESIAEANRRMDETQDPTPECIVLPKEAPREIDDIAATRDRMLNTILKVSAERLRLVEFIRETFGRYVTPEVVEEILTKPESRSLGGKRETVTILMSDLRGFTRLSEEHDPEEVVRLLNRYLGRMSDVILRYHGLIDEFIGDAIMVIFGAPTKREDDPMRAVACGLAMQNELARLNREIMEEGWPTLEMGIGINTGPVIVGNIGSAKRVKYGIVGAAVNTTSRIESNSIGGQVLIGESTYLLTGETVLVEDPRTVMMKGIHRPLVFYPVVSMGAPYNLELTPVEPAGTDTRLNLPVNCWLLEDKRIVGEPCGGETLSFNRNTIEARLADHIKPLTDVMLRLSFCTEAHCFEDIYAKVTNVEQTPDGPIHELKITSMTEEDRNLLEKWRKEAG